MYNSKLLFHEILEMSQIALPVLPMTELLPSTMKWLVPGQVNLTLLLFYGDNEAAHVFPTSKSNIWS